MSAGAPNDGINFHLRFVKDQIAGDMAAAKTQVVAETKKINDAAKAVFDKDPIRPRIDKEGLRKDLEQLAQMKAALATATVGSNREILQSAIGGLEARLGSSARGVQVQPLAGGMNVANVDVMLANAANSLRAADTRRQAQMEGFDNETNSRFKATAISPYAASKRDAAVMGGMSIGSAQGVLRGVGAIAAIEATKQTYAQINVIAAAISGEYDDQVAAAKALEETIRAFPIIGEEALWLHKAINEQVYDRITGEKQYLDTIKEATRAQEIHTDILAMQAKAQADFYRDQDQRVKSIGTSLDPFATAEQRAQAEVNAQTTERDRIRDDPRNIDPKTKKMTATSQAALEEANKRLNNLLAAAAIVRDEKMQQSSAEVEAARLRSIGEVAKAEELDFEAGLQKRERAAARESKDELDAARQTNIYLREIRKQRLEAETADETNAQEDQRQKARNVFEESLVELREQQEREAKEAVQQMEEIADAEEAVRVASVGTVGLAPQSFVTSGASAMQGIFGPQGQRVIGDVQKATDYLRQIRDNGMIARAS